jgi:Na+-transporting methylmalonyl-CoA/oxaloacetate decarboxylase gamma subunit
MPHTALGRVIAAVLTITGMLLVLFFFTAFLVVVVAVIAGLLVWSALVGKKKETKIKAEEISAEYEVLKDEERVEKGTGARLLPRNPPVDSITVDDKYN